jgi:serine protease AprX
MDVAYAISWDDAKTRRVVRAVLLMFLAVLLAEAAGSLARAFPTLESVIVRAVPGEMSTASRLVTNAGGHVTGQIGLIDGVVANVPTTAVAGIAGNPSIIEVTPNVAGHLDSSSFNATGDVDSMYSIEQMDGARAYWGAGYTGQGVGVALIDSGVAPVNGLSASGKVINGPDLSFESRDSGLQYLDTYGHGTFMAGIIAGRDNNVGTVNPNDTSDFMGMAPNATIVSIKVSDALGETDVSQVIAAIDWVVQHKNDRGMNIRVLNLSFGTDSTQSYALDPLAYATEQAWKHGIVVVVSAGNGGPNTATLSDPAIDPYVIAVGAADTNGSTAVSNDSPASFTSTGNGVRNPDLAAPGVHVVSLRDPGSYVDTQFGGTATVASRFFTGSGTSEAAAVVSGAAALIVSQHTSITPDQVKALMTGTTASMHGTASRRGSGELSLASALNASVPQSVQNFTDSTGTGSLEGSRGSDKVVDQDGNALSGEQDAFGNSVNTAALAWAEANGRAWRGGMFNGSSWSGYGWNGSSWSGSSWSGSSWSSGSWSGSSWSTFGWDGSSWSGSSWSSGSWSGSSWSGSSWSGSSWSGSSWSGSSWSTDIWS